MYYISRLLNILFKKKKSNKKKSPVSQEYHKCTSNKNGALICFCVMEAKTSSLNKKEMILNVT